MRLTLTKRVYQQDTAQSHARHHSEVLILAVETSVVTPGLLRLMDPSVDHLKVPNVVLNLLHHLVHGPGGCVGQVVGPVTGQPDSLTTDRLVHRYYRHPQPGDQQSGAEELQRELFTDILPPGSRLFSLFVLKEGCRGRG